MWTAVSTSFYLSFDNMERKNYVKITLEVNSQVLSSWAIIEIVETFIPTFIAKYYTKQFRDCCLLSQCPKIERLYTNFNHFFSNLFELYNSFDFYWFCFSFHRWKLCVCNFARHLSSRNWLSLIWSEFLWRNVFALYFNL